MIGLCMELLWLKAREVQRKVQNIIYSLILSIGRDSRTQSEDLCELGKQFLLIRCLDFAAIGREIASCEFHKSFLDIFCVCRDPTVSRFFVLLRIREQCEEGGEKTLKIESSCWFFILWEILWACCGALKVYRSLKCSDIETLMNRKLPHDTPK